MALAACNPTCTVKSMSSTSRHAQEMIQFSVASEVRKLLSEAPNMDAESEEAPCSAQKPSFGQSAALACSGPTIDDVGIALSRSILPDHGFSSTNSNSVVFPLVRGGGFMDKSEKYTLRITTCATEVAEDGYKWRKYGQKFLKNSSNPRSYYRCTNPRCNAKKRVERSKEDPQMLVITYEGVHLHYPNSHLFLPRPLPPKRPKQPPLADFPWMVQEGNDEVAVADSVKSSEQDVEERVFSESDVHKVLLEDPGWNQQGLLEDIVPFLIRSKPCGS